MNEHISKTLLGRNEFIFHLENDLSKNKTSQKEKLEEIEKLTETIKNVKFLGTKPEWDSMIPLGKRIYIPGKIKHTGEYYLEMKAHPYSYHILATLQQAIDHLEKKKEICEDHMEKYSEIEAQLLERIELLGGKQNDRDANSLLPEHIYSDRGVAVRVGEFYEILEFEE